MRKETYAIPRPKYPTEEDLKEHLKTVGKTLIEKADEMRINPDGCRSITLLASIKPNEEVTSVSVLISYNADPRIKKEN